MLFNSYIFVLLFLPLCIFGYFLLNHFKKYNFAQFFLLAMSLWFYGYFNIKYLWIISFSVIFNYVFYCLLNKHKNKAIFIFALAVNIGLLLYFKYTDFFIITANKIFHTNYNLLNIVLPLGISFFTFQQISFIVDTYKGEITPPHSQITRKYNFLHYASYVTYFPQLIAGPIVTHDELIPQFMDKSKKQINWKNMAQGFYIFTLGLSKKVLIADFFGNAVNWAYSNPQNIHSIEALIAMLSYTFQIYFDFSAYSDMAMGIGKMMNIDLPKNFNSPYKACTITQFWDRWHITLTRFLTKYIYIPLGGSRIGELKTYINIFIVFFISGFWHGAGFSFIIWGVLHGIFSIITKKFSRLFEKLPKFINWLITFTFLNLTWVFFRAPTTKRAIQFFKCLFDFNFSQIDIDFLQNFSFSPVEILLKHFNFEIFSSFIGLFVLLVLAFLLILFFPNSSQKMENFKTSRKNTILISFLLFLCIFQFGNISTFLYFNF